MGGIETAVKVLANTFSVLTSLSPAPSLYKAYRAKDLGELSALPLVSMFINNFSWLAYGILAIDIFPLVTTFAVGTVLSVVYVAVYFSLTSERKYVAKLVLWVAIGLAIFVLYIVLGLAGVTNQSRDGVATVAGFVADVGTLMLFTSPFETIFHVLRTKNASSMPFHLCLVGAVCNSLWLTYGIIITDWILIVPNIICSVVGWIQVVVYIIYRPGRFAKQDQQTATDADSDGKDLEAAYAMAASPKPLKV